MQLIGWKQLKSTFSTSLWAVPILAIPFAMIATRALHWLDAQTEWTLLGFGVAGAQTMLQAAVTAALSFLVFTFASLLVAIQVASGQLTPRIIATTLLRNEVVRYTVGLFMFTLLFAVSVQGRIDAKVHQLPLFVASALAVACFAAFLYLINSASKLLRPITILTNVGNSGIAVIKDVYPEPSLGPDVAKPTPKTRLAGSSYSASRNIEHSPERRYQHSCRSRQICRRRHRIRAASRRFRCSR